MNREKAIGILNVGLIDILERNRGTDDKHQRGRKVVTGRRMVEDTATADPVQSTCMRLRRAHPGRQTSKGHGRDGRHMNNRCLLRVFNPFFFCFA